jgi:hypothetical protein
MIKEGMEKFVDAFGVPDGLDERIFKNLVRHIYLSGVLSVLGDMSRKEKGEIVESLSSMMIEFSEILKSIEKEELNPLD